MSIFTRRTPFVNEGPDPRIGGWLGEVLAKAQRATLRYTTEAPKRIVFQRGEWGHVAVYDPFFFSLFLKREDGYWWSFRIGARFDPYIGDGNNPKEPRHTPPGGTFFDVIVKPKIDNEVVQ